MREEVIPLYAGVPRLGERETGRQRRRNRERETEREKERRRDTERQRERERDREKERHRERGVERVKEREKRETKLERERHVGGQESTAEVGLEHGGDQLLNPSLKTPNLRPSGWSVSPKVSAQQASPGSLSRRETENPELNDSFFF